MKLPNCATWETIGVVVATRSDVTVLYTTPTQLQRVAVRDTLSSETCAATALYASHSEVVAHPHVFAKDSLQVEQLEGLPQPLTRPSIVR